MLFFLLDKAFVTKLGDIGDSNNSTNHNNDDATAEKSRDFQIHTGSKVKKIAAIRSLEGIPKSPDQDKDSTYNTDQNLLHTSKSTDTFSFDVYEREGVNEIMSQVNKTSDQDDFAQSVCDYFEVFESLAVGRCVWHCIYLLF